MSLHTPAKTRFTELKQLFPREHSAAGAAMPAALPPSQGMGRAQVADPVAVPRALSWGQDQQGATPEKQL